MHTYKHAYIYMYISEIYINIYMNVYLGGVAHCPYIFLISYMMYYRPHIRGIMCHISYNLQSL